ncbi:Planctomycete cytochrome C [Thalassoglobus neptunius]|uniref:Planctomycete cytochrome C n=1 Tax=Thalassoglobus neptunius TaxID=1938619 RepID=A0A5C5VYG8_9PLAN|nr:PSD1 and planctomycete cytochrome C domain-containing protein [Thalassoglobus neptunius]TWT42789.1 Planctomycete cytochrome C [Thalassoglobus neptunius]
MKTLKTSTTIVLVFSLVLTATADDQKAAENRTPEDPSSATDFTFFEAKIRPVLIKHCYDCHSLEAGSAEGELRVDVKSALRAGGGRGPAVVPGQPDASLLLTAMLHEDSDLKMPPKEERLSDDVIHDFRKWIEMGVPDPRISTQQNTNEDWRGKKTAETFWAYQSPQESTAGEVSNSEWLRDEIDRFIMHELDRNDLAPATDAEPHILLRRLYFDLVGLPPSPDDLVRFRKAIESLGVEKALANEVDSLLESPQFGEHWGRHWLDVARFGESSGKEANIPFPYAWRYRDYVIESVNSDIPVDRFFTEQIAGDLLPYESPKERARLLVATGFLAVGTKNLSESNDKQFLADIIDEQIDSLSRGLMASSVACARCHDHKFDPFSMEDYYALAGIFESTKTYFGTFVSPASRQGGDLMELPHLKGQTILHPSVTPQKVQELKERLEELRAEKAEIDAAQRALFSGKKPRKTFTLRDVLANIWRTGPIVGKLQTIDDDGRALPVAMGVSDRELIRDAHFLARGEVSRPGEPIPRRFPRAIRLDETPQIPDGQSGRLQLAEWLTDPQHPLTSRVFVNRVWHHLFGTGIVRTVDDFGTTGELPSHPELLDAVAVQFVNDGWSLKRLVRRLVLTRTYRQASEFNRTNFLQDPENRLLWRMPKRRLPAESIRDAMLVVSDELDMSRPEGSLVGRMILDKPISLIGLDRRLPTDLDGSLHRSVYLPVIRDRLPDVLELFDFAEPSLVTGDREQTNVPVQALYLMNSPFVLDRSRGFASRLEDEAETNEDRIERAFQLCFARSPDREELERSLDFLNPASTSADQLDADRNELLMSFCQALLATAEFRNID